MIKEIENIINQRIEDTKINFGEIHLITTDEFDFNQQGYRVDLDGYPIKDWIGEEYFVIGNETCCGDPILVNIKDTSVYSMFHDSWDSILKIADTYEEFIANLKRLQNIDVTNEDEVDIFLQEVEKASPQYIEYWETITESLDDED